MFRQNLLMLFLVIHVYGSEKPLVIIIPSYNNATRCEQNLSSIFQQQYDNYRIIYLDDASSDETVERVMACAQAYNQEQRCMIVCAPQRRHSLAAVYHAIHAYVADDEIVICVDGDDFLAHNSVLSLINTTYDDEQVWMTYGSYAHYPSGSPGLCHEIPPGIHARRAYREHAWVTSHLRTYYAWLFKQIRLQDLLYEGEFFKQACDMAVTFPLLEMAGQHACYLSQTLYYYNNETGNNVHTTNVVRQCRMGNVIRAASYRYKPLTQKPTIAPPVGELVDVIMLAYHPEQVWRAALTALGTHAQGISSITVLCMNEALNGTAHLRSNPHVRWLPVHSSAACVLALAQVMRSPTSPYVLLLHDGIALHAPCDLTRYAYMLDQTRAYGFYLMLTGNDQLRQGYASLIFDDHIAWQYADVAYPWREIITFSGGLYRKKDIMPHLMRGDYNSLERCQVTINSGRFDWQAVGLARGAVT